MILLEVRISNFRSLKETNWVKIHDLTAFIGENDGGKTACTDAIKLLFDKAAKPEEGDFTWEYDADENRHRRAEKIILEAKLKVKETEVKQVTEILGQEERIIHVKKRLTLIILPHFPL